MFCVVCANSNLLVCSSTVELGLKHLSDLFQSACDLACSPFALHVMFDTTPTKRGDYVSVVISSISADFQFSARTVFVGAFPPLEKQTAENLLRYIEGCLMKAGVFISPGPLSDAYDFVKKRWKACVGGMSHSSFIAIVFLLKLSYF